MQKIIVKLKPKYPIFITDSKSELNSAMAELPELLPRSKKIGVITNSRIKKLHYEPVAAALKKLGFEPVLFLMKEGEKYKEYSYAQSFFESLVKKGFDRHSALLALGGGVIGDFTGYLAAQYLRGIDFVQMPTTFLASVDASVGGKVAVNIGAGKNMVGSFYQPKAVYVHLPHLTTLPAKEWRIGWAEVIKHALIGDKKLYRLLLAAPDKIKNNAKDLVADAILHSVKLKASVVAKDEKEGGLRAILNFGHTVGHAIESFFNYQTISHGDGVGIGMVTALMLSVRQNGLSESKMWEAYNLIQAAGLPQKSKVPASEIIKHMQYDKKKSAGSVKFVLLEDIGRATFGHEVDNRSLRQLWERQQKINERNRKF